MRRKRAHEGCIGVASDGTDVDEALVLAEGKLESLLGCIVFCNHGLVFLRVEGVLGVVVENDGSTSVDGKHRLVAHSVTACESGPFALLLCALGGEDILVAFLDEGVSTSCYLKTDSVECALEVKELGLGADDSVNEAERSGLRGLNRRDGNTLANRVDFDVNIRTYIDSAAIFSLILTITFSIYTSFVCFLIDDKIKIKVSNVKDFHEKNMCK